MVKILTRDKIQRMSSGTASSSVGYSLSGAGGGGIGNGVSIEYYEQNFTLLYKTVVTVTDSESEVISTTTTYTTAGPNAIVPVGTNSEYDETTGYTTTTTISLIGPKALNSLVIGDLMLVYDSANNAIKVVNRDNSTTANFYATGGVSAFGMTSGGGGGGGGGIDIDTVWSALAANTNQQINISHLTNALAGYASTSQLAGYLPLTGGTMANTNVVTNLNADLLDGEHASAFAHRGQANNMMTSNNECNLIPDNYNNDFWFNYQSVSRDGSSIITGYNFGNGRGSAIASIDSSGNYSGNAATATSALSAGNADTVDNFHAGVENGKVVVLVPWPTYYSFVGTKYVSSDYGQSGYGYPEEEYLQAVCKWAIDTYANKGKVTLIGSIEPNSSGTCILHLYSNNGKDATSLLPSYCSGTYTTLTGYVYNFGTLQSVWYYRKIEAGYADTSGEAIALQTARTIWGQSFDGTANVSGAITGATTITASGDITGANLLTANQNNAFIQIGNIRILYDQTNNALKIVQIDGVTAANLYATGGISALGVGTSGGGGSIDLSTVWSALAANTAEQINVSHLSNALSSYALSSQIPTNNNQLINGAGYITASALNGYALISQIPTNNNQLTNGAGYVTGTVLETTLSDYVTNTSLATTLGGYVTATSLATTLGSYVTSSALATTLTGYALKTWVSQNYLGINANAVSATKLQTARTIWGQWFDGTGNVSGSINGATSIELSFTTPFIDFHYNNSASDYTSRLIAYESGVLSLETGTSQCGFVVGDNINNSFVQIGNARLVWDSTNNAIKVINDDGTAANFYATGGVAALGLSAGTSVDSMTFNYLTVNNRMTLNSEVRMASYLQIMSTSNTSDTINMFNGTQSSKINYQSYQYIQFDNIGVVGTDYSYDESWWIDPDGCAKFNRVYLDSTRYLYISGGSLKYYNGSSTITIA